MKKNKMMRIASVLLVLVLLSTSIISGTFAKYVTSGEVEDSARVAKFGVVVTGSGSLFDKTYYAATQNTPANGAEDTDNVTLTVEAEQNVVAPGTKNDDGLTLSVTGTPEVDVNVKFDFSAVEEIFLAKKAGLPNMTTADTTDKFENEEAYYPVVFYVGGTLVDNLDNDLLESMGFHIVITGDTVWDDTGLHGTYIIGGNLDAVKALFNYINNDGEGVYVDANTDLATAIGSLTLTWKWDFDDNGKGTYDKQDTLLGDLAAAKLAAENYDGTVTLDGVTLTEGTDFNLTTNVSFRITVTQVD